MTPDKPLWTQADYDAFNAKQDRITANAVARAKIVQAKITIMRASLEEWHTNNNGDGQNATVLLALFQSYEAELSRLCALPGVMNALYGDEVTP